MDLKKAYYYIICLASLLALLWGVVDLAGAGIGLATTRVSAPAGQMQIIPDTAADQSLDIYYQRRVMNDRLVDSLARIIVSGLVFAYSRTKVEKA